MVRAIPQPRPTQADGRRRMGIGNGAPRTATSLPAPVVGSSVGFLPHGAGCLRRLERVRHCPRRRRQASGVGGRAGSDRSRVGHRGGAGDDASGDDHASSRGTEALVWQRSCDRSGLSPLGRSNAPGAAGRRPFDGQPPPAISATALSPARTTDAVSSPEASRPQTAYRIRGYARYMDPVRVRAWVGTVIFLLLAPGVVAGLIPGLITGWRNPRTDGWLQCG